MCIIIYKPVGTRFNLNKLEKCAEANPDGWGMMWSDGRKLSALKELRPWDGLDIVPWVPGAIHFRTASIGQITLGACHPHLVNENYAFMHNGNLFHFRSPGLTDSQVFAQFMQQVGPNNVIRSALEEYFRRNYSKGLFMDNTGFVEIINEQAGIWEDGCWYSNGGIENYVGYGYSGAYEYHENDVRHKGGLISMQGFSGDWQQCSMCKGWFKNINKLCEDCKGYESLSSN